MLLRFAVVVRRSSLSHFDLLWFIRLSQILLNLIVIYTTLLLIVNLNNILMFFIHELLNELSLELVEENG
jgi:hypothetical protein